MENNVNVPVFILDLFIKVKESWKEPKYVLEYCTHSQNSMKHQSKSSITKGLLVKQIRKILH